MEELCFNLVKVAGNLLTMCGVIGESITNLVNMVGNFMKSGANNGILLGMLLTVLIQKDKFFLNYRERVK